MIPCANPETAIPILRNMRDKLIFESIAQNMIRIEMFGIIAPRCESLIKRTGPNDMLPVNITGYLLIHAHCNRVLYIPVIKRLRRNII